MTKLNTPPPHTVLAVVPPGVEACEQGAYARRDVMDETPAGGSSGGKDGGDIQDFLEILEGQFKGRRCFLGQYAKAREGGLLPADLFSGGLKKYRERFCFA